MHTQITAALPPLDPGPVARSAPTARLTARQRDVVALVVEGLTNIEIAARLHISDRTVQSHVAAAMRHLGSTSRTHLAVTALRAGLVPLHPLAADGDEQLGRAPAAPVAP